LRYERETFRVYRIDKQTGELLLVGTPALCVSFREAAKQAATGPGEYLVFTLDYLASFKVAVTYEVKSI